MKSGYSIMRAGITTSPHSLLSLDTKLKNVANTYLPYDTGIEIECELKNYNWDVDDMFQNKIPTLKDVNCSSEEQRFRLPTGIEGMITLYDLCELLKKEALLNNQSGIHYHIDMTDVFHLIDNKFITNNNDWIIKSLESWNYTGSFNEKRCSWVKTWVKYHKSNRTLEIRIGEMSFDYELIIKRILHCQNIVKKLKSSLMSLNEAKLPKIIGKIQL